MWSKVERLSRAVQESAHRKAARFLLLTRRSQRDIIESDQTEGGIWDGKEIYKGFRWKTCFSRDHSELKGLM